MKKSEVTDTLTIETIERIRAARRMKQSTCFPQQDISVTNLEHEIDRTRDSLSWPFEHAGESFAAYMDHVTAFNSLRDPVDSSTLTHLDRQRSALLESYPAPDQYCQNLEYRSHLVEACLNLARAEVAWKLRNPEEAWFYISEAKKCLGRAEGYYQVAADQNMKTSRATHGGHQKARNAKDKERQLYIQLLGALSPTQGWKSDLEALKKVSSEAARILDLFNLPVGDVYARFSEALNSDADIKAALKKNMYRSIG